MDNGRVRGVLLCDPHVFMRVVWANIEEAGEFPQLLFMHKTDLQPMLCLLKALWR